MNLISVVMPVFNGMPYLPEAIKSILNQTYPEFELIIIDDGSTDGSVQYVSGLHEKKIRLIKHEVNKGIGVALQEGVNLSRGEYIARLDSDDISHEKRLEIQASIMDTNPGLGLLGTSYKIIDNSGYMIDQVAREESDVMLRWKVLFKNPFVHSSVMFRKKILSERNLNYLDTLNQDYFLWAELMKFSNVKVISDQLICLRRHSRSLTSTKALAKWDLQVRHSFQLVISLMEGQFPYDEDTYGEFYEWIRGNRNVDSTRAVEFTNAALCIWEKFIREYRPREKEYFIRELNRLVRRGRSGFEGRFSYQYLTLLGRYAKCRLKLGLV